MREKVTAEEWQATLNAILKEWRSQKTDAPTLTREQALDRMKHLGISIGEAERYLTAKRAMP